MMDPLALAAGAASVAGFGTALRMRHRACRAEAVAGRLAAELRAERHAASHDPLTGLLNRRAFHQLGAELVAGGAPDPLAAAVLDLDGFKQVNDRLGHAAGDEVLITVARRLVAGTGDGLAARLGGDEFAGLLSSPTVDECWLAATAAALRETVGAPMRISGHQVRITVSVGLVPVPQGTQLADALRRADAAMYRAKSRQARHVRDGERCWSPGICPPPHSRRRDADHTAPAVPRFDPAPPRELVDTARMEAGGQ